MTRIHWVENPPAAFSEGHAEAFLERLGQPTGIVLSGRDNSRCRALVTLSHGNEPSGFFAVQHYLQSGQVPAVKTVIVLPSVHAALLKPRFSHRMADGARDLNRCFKPPFAGEQGALAKAILEDLQAHKPEAVVDMHNTSGSGPGFGVVTHMDWRHDALVSLFVQRMIVTKLTLGSLMEVSETLFPTVTIETGGRLDDDAHELAYEGLCRYFNDDEVLIPHAADWDLDRLLDPVRLELRPDAVLCYADTAQPHAHITLHPEVERYNFGAVKAGTELGWVTAPVATLFTALDKNGNCALDKILATSGNTLKIASDLRLFMFTNNAAIAKSDCLFYAVHDDGKSISA
ncbi:MAG: succinylglutamate desuccinylase [Gammaproteobacteria bacterium]|nr:MAG: succinylglutamate desuccinylase [Gammaproteobacteria bacterium]